MVNGLAITHTQGPSLLVAKRIVSLLLMEGTSHVILPILFSRTEVRARHAERRPYNCAETTEGEATLTLMNVLSWYIYITLPIVCRIEICWSWICLNILSEMEFNNWPDLVYHCFQFLNMIRWCGGWFTKVSSMIQPPVDRRCSQFRAVVAWPRAPLWYPSMRPIDYTHRTYYTQYCSLCEGFPTSCECVTRTFPWAILRR